MTRSRAVSMLVLSAFIASCASHQQYRKTQPPIPEITLTDIEKRNPVPEVPGGKPTCSELLLRQRSIERFRSSETKTPFTIGVIEIGDDGNVKDVAQRDQVFKELAAYARAHNGATVVTFVHGWHHRAKVCDENLSCFRRVIEGLAERNHDRAPVFGIYVGWRGESAHHLADLTFYSRKATAHYVGSLAGRDIFLQLDHIRNDLNTELRNTNGYVSMVTVGHSFGGALVYSAMESLMVSEAGSVKARRTGIGDLVVLVNPAFEASRYQIFADDIAANGQSAPDQHPVLLTVASQADDAVGKAFPAGRILWLAWHPFAWRKARAEVTGLGHYPPYTTHELVFSGKQPKADTIVELKDNAELERCHIKREEEEDLVRSTCDCSYPTYKNADPLVGTTADISTLRAGKGTVRGVENATISLRPLHGGEEFSPYIVATAPRELISGHNDIYNPNFIAFLIAFVDSTLDQQQAPSISRSSP